MNDISTVDGALAFAVKAHAGQVDKGRFPYVLHPIRVGSGLWRYGYEAMTTGFLHDIVEDTDYTFEDLESFGSPEKVLVALRLLTKSRDMDYFDYVKSCVDNPLACLVKTADVIDNLARLDSLPSDQAERLKRKYEDALVILRSQAHSDYIGMLECLNG